MKQFVTKPSAWITAPNKDKKPSDGNNVYLRNGEEFMIALKNPTQNKVKAVITINGERLEGLVLNPAQTAYLECYPSDKRKFLFSTYKVVNTEENEYAIANNGMIEVKFYNELVTSYRHTDYTTTLNDRSIWDWLPKNLSYPKVPNVPFDSHVSYSSDLPTSRCIDDEIETGRVEKGDYSDTNFKTVYLNWESFECAKYSFKLLPESMKPLEVKNIKTPNVDEISEKILLITELYEKGILTYKEYQEKKSELLARI